MFASILVLKFALVVTGNCISNWELFTDFTPNNCYNNNQYYLEEECLPLCKNFPANETKVACSDDEPCVPGYYCGTTRKCRANTNSCAIFYANTTDNVKTKYYTSLFKPGCDKDGSWAAKQCKGETSTGRCFCFNSVGKRIFGQEWSNKADDMTCACSRKKASYAETQPNRMVTLHCDGQGNYEPLQCNGGQCWCVEGKTGELASTVVPDSVMPRLPCYGSKKVGSQYLRQCESRRYAQNKIIEELRLHGTNTDYETLYCDEDGSYGQHNIKNSEGYCSWIDGTQIESWRSTNPAEQNCNCARDYVIHKRAGQPFNKKCLENGNYKSLQRANSKYYCVDIDGYKNSPDSDQPESDTDCGKYYSNIV